MARYLSSRRLVALIVGVGASTSVALCGSAPALATEGASIAGSGSLLQGAAQSLWVSKWSTESGLSNAPTITYHATSNQEGLDEFGNGTGKLKPGASGLDAFAASDDAPNGPEIADAERASGSTEITVPVAQEPVVVLLSLPKGISDVERDGTAASSIDLTNSLVAETWDGEVAASSSPAYAANTWGALLTDAGYTFASAAKSGGTRAIDLRTSRSGAGTDYVFKQYLSEITDVYVPYSNDNDEWPVAVKNGGANSATSAQKTAEHPGSIGYAYLVDAVASVDGAFSSVPTVSTYEGSASHLIAYGLIQDNGRSTESPIFANAESSGSTEANVDINDRIGTSGGESGAVGNWVDPETADGSWAGTYASDPDVYEDAGFGIEEAFYPIVGVTYELAWGNYATSELERRYGGSQEAATLTGDTVNSYLTFVLHAAGQNLIKTDYYAPLPAVPNDSARIFQISAVNGGS